MSLPDEYRRLVNAINERMSKVKHKIVIVSGKGGVGKSFVAASLAVATAMTGRSVGVLDADIHGPSIPRIMGLNGYSVFADINGNIIPVEGPLNILVFSVQFLLPSEDSPVIWRGPLKSRAILEMLARVNWGELDYLYIDLPPGTGDEVLTIAQQLSRNARAIVVTIPTELSRVIVRKAVKFCKQLGIPVIGIVENMKGFTCPKCNTYYDIFPGDAGIRIAKEENIEYLGSIPLDPRVNEYTGRNQTFLQKYPESPVAKAVTEICSRIIRILEGGREEH